MPGSWLRSTFVMLFVCASVCWLITGYVFAHSESDEQAQYHYNKATELLKSKDYVGAIEHYEATISVWEKLVNSDSDNRIWRNKLIDAHDNLAWVHNRLGSELFALDAYAGAIEQYRIAISTRQKLVNIDPDNKLWRNRLAVYHEILGKALSEQKDYAGAINQYKTAILIRQELTSIYPDDKILLGELSLSHKDLSLILSEHENYAGAIEQYEIAIRLWRKLVDSEPDGWWLFETYLEDAIIKMKELEAKL